MKFWKIAQQETTLDDIVTIAQQLVDAKKRWHFHILTPSCKLNESGDFVLFLENCTDQEFYTVHANQKPSDVGKQLVQLLHGKDVLHVETTSAEYTPTAVMKEMIDRAKELNSQQKPWHHHMLFPDCKFNSSGKWMLFFECAEPSEELSSLSETEPTEDLKQIETLFYQGTN